MNHAARCFWTAFIFVVWLVFACSNVLAAQHTVTLNAGLTNFHIQDDYVSAMAFRGNLVSVAGSYRLQTNHGQHGLNVAYGKGQLKAGRWQYEGTNYMLSASYRYLHHVFAPKLAGMTIQLSAGGGLSSGFWLTDYYKDPPFTSYTKSWLWMHSLDLAVQSDCALSRNHRLSAQLCLPAVRQISRPEYAILSRRQNEVDRHFYNAARYGKWEAPWDSFMILGTITYEVSIFRKTRLQGSYGFDYLSYDSPVPVASFTNRLLVGLARDL